jgi:hypothetical protein
VKSFTGALEVYRERQGQVKFGWQAGKKPDVMPGCGKNRELSPLVS